MKLELLPVTNGGLVVTDDHYILVTAGKLKVAAVQFLNQGINTSATITFGGVTITLAPGAGEAISAPTGGYDTTDYYIDIDPIDPALSATNKLRILVQKYID